MPAPSLPLRLGLLKEYRGVSYIIRDANNFPVASVYFESEPGRRTAANLMTKDRRERLRTARQASGSAQAAAVLRGVGLLLQISACGDPVALRARVRHGGVHHS